MDTLDLYISRCKDASETQEWTIDKVNYDMVESWDDDVDPVTGPLEKY